MLKHGVYCIIRVHFAVENLYELLQCFSTGLAITYNIAPPDIAPFCFLVQRITQFPCSFVSFHIEQRPYEQDSPAP